MADGARAAHAATGCVVGEAIEDVTGYVRNGVARHRGDMSFFAGDAISWDSFSSSRRRIKKSILENTSNRSLFCRFRICDCRYSIGVKRSEIFFA